MDPGDVRGPVGRIAVAHPDLAGAAGGVAQLTKSVLSIAVEVSVVVVRGAGVQTVAATGGVARVLDGWQQSTGQGPGLHAASAASVVCAADLRVENRWPRWVRHGVDVGARSVLSFGFGIDDLVTGALTVYAPQPDAFPDDVIGVARSLAGYAAAALRVAYRHEAQAAQVRHVQAAMVHRAVIEQAKGIIMGERRCTPDEAFAVLAKVSQDSNRKVHDVAAALVHRAVSTPRPTGEVVTAPTGRAAVSAQRRRESHRAFVTARATHASSDAVAPPVRITTDTDGGGVAVIAVVGELVMDTADEFLAALTAVLAASGVTRVVVDLDKVSFLDMAALSALLQARAAVLRAGASFAAIRAHHSVRQVLHLTGTCPLLTAAAPAPG